jgi:hypothetical protein
VGMPMSMSVSTFPAQVSVVASRYVTIGQELAQFI